MGILSDIGRDIRMGFDRSARDQDYYDRTARTIESQRGSAAGDLYRSQTADMRAAAPMTAPERGGFSFFGGDGGGRNVFAQQPRTRTPDEEYNLFRDMFDGGGMGYSGAAFRGSLPSIALNLAGVRPAGSEQDNPYGLLSRVTGETAERNASRRRPSPARGLGAPQTTPPPMMRPDSPTGLLPVSAVAGQDLPPSELDAAIQALESLNQQEYYDSALPSYYDAVIPTSETAAPPLNYSEWKSEVAKRADINRYPEDMLQLGYQDYAAMQGIDPRTVR